MGRQGVRLSADAGQAAVEWVGVVLVVLLALGGVAASRPDGLVASEAADAPAEVVGSAVRQAGLRGPPPRGRLGRAPPPSRLRSAPPPLRLRGAGAVARRGKLVAALRTLRAAGKVIVRRAWIVCLGYVRFRYELEHPRLANEPMPLDEAIEIANGCLNPYAFVAED